MSDEEKILMAKRSFEISLLFHCILSEHFGIDTPIIDKTQAEKPFWTMYRDLQSLSIRYNAYWKASADHYKNSFEERHRLYVREITALRDNTLFKHLPNLTFFFNYKPADLSAVPLLPAEINAFWEMDNMVLAADLVDGIKNIQKEMGGIEFFKLELFGAEKVPKGQDLGAAAPLTAIAISPYSETAKEVMVSFSNGQLAMVSVQENFNGTDPLFLDNNNQLLPQWQIENGWLVTKSKKEPAGSPEIPIMAKGLARHPESDKVLIVTFDNGQKAIASLADHFSDDYPIFVDQRGYLLPGWTIVNDWITPVPKPLSAEVKPFVPPAASVPKTGNPLDDANAKELSSAFLELYLAEYGIKKSETIYNKVRYSSKVAKYIDHLKKQKQDPGKNGFLYVLNSIPYFILSKGETLCTGTLIAINRWLEAVEFTSSMPSEERLHEIVKATILRTEATKSHISGKVNFFDKYFSYLKERMQEP